MEIPDNFGHSAVTAEVTINNVTRIDINCSKCLFAGGFVMTNREHARELAATLVMEHMRQTDKSNEPS